MEIGTLGPEGTYSHMAARKIGKDVVFFDGVYEIAQAVSGEKSVDAGVLPIENSIEGSVTPTLDVLMEFDLYINNEIVVDIHHALIAENEDFDVVISHPQALRQCREYLDENYPDVKRKTASSTARAAETASKKPEVAAIAHPQLASNNLTILDTDIQDEEHNNTRFIHVEPKPRKTTKNENDIETGSRDRKTTVIVYPGKDRPGLLYEILGVFKHRGVNLSRIESRPSKHELGDYVFHIDFNGGNVPQILDELRDTVEWVEFKGSYDRVK